MPARTYYVEIVLTVDAEHSEHMHDEQAIRDEAQSWLESLRATVHAVTVRPADSPERS